MTQAPACAVTGSHDLDSAAFARERTTKETASVDRRLHHTEGPGHFVEASRAPGEAVAAQSAKFRPRREGSWELTLRDVWPDRTPRSFTGLQRGVAHPSSIVGGGEGRRAFLLSAGCLRANADTSVPELPRSNTTNHGAPKCKTASVQYSRWGPACSRPSVGGSHLRA